MIYAHGEMENRQHMANRIEGSHRNQMFHTYFICRIFLYEYLLLMQQYRIFVEGFKAFFVREAHSYFFHKISEEKA